MPVRRTPWQAPAALISPDHRYVAYVAAQNERAWNLHVARTDGGGEVQVSSAPAGSAGAGYYAWAPDSSLIAYLASEEGGFGYPRELYTVRPDGSDKVKVSGPLGPGGVVYGFGWAPDGSRLAYSADPTPPARSSCSRSAPTAPTTCAPRAPWCRGA